MNQQKRLTIRWFVPLLVAWSAASHGEEFTDSWVSLKYAPCEGIGAAGSFRVNAQGTITTKDKDGSRTITALAVHASSAAFTQGDGSVTGRVVVNRAPGTSTDILLTRPLSPAVEPAPKADETRNVYLPQGKTVAVPANAQVTVSASAIVKTPAGVCALGSSDHQLKLP